MNFKKGLSLALALIITATILFFYVSFNGNFASKWMAKNTAEAYLQEKYEDGNFVLNVHGYNFKDGTYVFSYRVNEDGKAMLYHMEIGYQLLPKEIVYDYLDLDYE